MSFGKGISGVGSIVALCVHFTEFEGATNFKAGQIYQGDRHKKERRGVPYTTIRRYIPRRKLPPPPPSRPRSDMGNSPASVCRRQKKVKVTRYMHLYMTGLCMNSMG